MAGCAGITQRDLKPANVILTKSGAKLLDFVDKDEALGGDRELVDAADREAF